MTGAVATIDVLDDTGSIVTAKVTPETEEAIENAYAAIEGYLDTGNSDIDDEC